MRSLKDVEPETTVVVKEITGGLDVKEHLEELGVTEGTGLEVLATEPVHVHWGPIALRTNDQDELVIARGWADKIYVEKEGEITPLLVLEEGDTGTVRSIEGGKDFEGFLSEYGIVEGSELAFLRHVPDCTMVVSSGDAEMRMGEGQASKIFVTQDGKSIQLNHLKEGESSTVEKIVGGTHVKEKFEQIGLAEGSRITLLRREIAAPAPDKGTYIRANVGGQHITIGHGLAEKVLVS
ncbi:MAG: ferrous iron transport protein A [ANME-2 cluster archaeon]|jgi:Fe2+ transport system protein FeoA|nr:MAG: ferrous iron transport protein A [ANME-2 cluster archaeon]